MVRTSYVIGLIVGFLSIGGCAPKHQVVPSSGPRPATTADHVKIYQNYPQKYERLGLVTVPVTPEIRWDKRGDSNLGFDRLKEQAAGKGANGLLLKVAPESYDALAGVGYHGKQYEVAMQAEPRAVVAEAIYVHEE